MRYHERMVMLSVIDGLWKDHLLSMDHLKEGINLRGYAQRDPLVEYKRESFDMFEAMMLKFQEDTVRFLFRMQIIGPDGQPVNAADAAARPCTEGSAGGKRCAADDGGWRTAGDQRFRRGNRRQRSTRSRRSSTARRSGSWLQRAVRVEATHHSLRNGAQATRSDATILAPAAAARNTRSATVWGSSARRGNLSV